MLLNVRSIAALKNSHMSQMVFLNFTKIREHWISLKTVTCHMWCSGILELITVISLSGTKCFHHFHSEKMFHNYRRACLQRCFIAVNILIANTSCGRSILSCDHCNDKEIKPCWYISNVLLGLAHTSELQSEYFPSIGRGVG